MLLASVLILKSATLAFNTCRRAHPWERPGTQAAADMDLAGAFGLKPLRTDCKQEEADKQEGADKQERGEWAEGEKVESDGLSMRTFFLLFFPTTWQTWCPIHRM